MSTSTVKVILLLPITPNMDTTALLPELNMPGMKTGEVNDSPKSVAKRESGAIKSANAYQRTGTRHLHKRESNSR